MYEISKCKYSLSYSIQILKNSTVITSEIEKNDQLKRQQKDATRFQTSITSLAAGASFNEYQEIIFSTHVNGIELASIIRVVSFSDIQNR